MNFSVLWTPDFVSYQNCILEKLTGISAIMRFRKGSKVEVLSKKEVPSGSWLRAKILCGNGHNYTVRYERSEKVTDTTTLERVSRNAIRPCPPLLEVMCDLVPGDVVEVLDNFSWKMATISDVLCKKYFLVRLLGSSCEFKVRRTDIRVRQSWLDDKWVVIGKGSGSYSNGKNSENSALKVNKISSFQIQKTNSRLNPHVDDDFRPVKNKLHFHASQITSPRTRKRESRYCNSQADVQDGTAQKFRAVENEHGRRQVVAMNSAVLAKHMDFGVLGSQEIHASLNQTAGVSDVNVERRETTCNAGCSFRLELELNDGDNVTCSVGSCSITRKAFHTAPHVYASPTEEFGDKFSDAESFCELRFEPGNCILPEKEDLAAEIHKLELHAYRCTMEALHASGPLSWEQEELVTNLRLLLHISNDEHLIEIKSLISFSTSIPLR